ncbi:hypothetical protein MHF_0341 [Mycoplasma haemofelis Ohio2]|uniref:Uncharacterized protein n=1 Tax=Mycoplasma haemofelis (strain Ohio2) TaxID=859194 RepID=F6FGU7_MYCHI|nr:hypothetical protein MHF_0341 [Mycoplasma haemofelis Ohio2]
MTPSKGAIALLSVGGAGATGAGIYVYEPFKSGETVRRLIDKQELFTLLEGSDSKWESAWTNYKAKNKGKKKGEDSWRLSNWVGDSTVLGNSFKEECSKRLSLRVRSSEDSSFLEFQNLCMRKTTVNDKLTKEGYEFLGMEDTNKTTWESNFQAYKQASTKDKVEGIEIASGEVHTTTDHLTKFKTACQAAISKAIDEVSYANTKRWCSKLKNA